MQLQGTHKKSQPQKQRNKKEKGISEQTEENREKKSELTYLD